jgi:phage terminase large subunit-like protein
MPRTYRPASSYLGTTEEARQAQLTNLIRGRTKRARKALVKPPSLRDPAYETDIIRFAEEQFFIIETRKPIVLEDWQKEELLRPVFCGSNRPTMALWGMTKKSGKSTLAAMVAAWVLFCGEDFSETYLAARDFQQSQWIVFSKLVRAIEMNPRMLVNVNITKDAVERPATGSVVRCLPTEVSAAGLNPSLTIFDELWSYEYESMRRFFEEMTTVPTRKNPLTLIVSYAGWDEDSLLHELYEKGQKGKDKTFFFYWSHKNLMKWQTPKYLSQQRGRLRPNTYLRLHENRWTSSESAFIPLEEWDDCVDRTHKPLIPGVIPSPPLYCAIDIGIKHDSSAVVAVYRDKNMVKLALAECWIPSRKNPLDIDETVGRYLRSVNKDFNLKVVYFDPWQCHQLATELKKEGIKMEEFPQTTDRLTRMGQNLYNLITGRNLLLYPHGEMRKHAEKTLAKETQRGFRLVKGKASQRIDLIIALAMACQGCVQKAQSSRPGKVYIVGD